MPAFSLTAKDLRQILENTNNYDAFVRNRPVTAKMPLTSLGYHARSRSRSKSRSRARSSSRSRVKHDSTYTCCKVDKNEAHRVVPPGLPRPQSAKNRPSSAKNRPTSAKMSHGERPQSAQIRPASAKHNLPKRPSSAHIKPTYTAKASHDCVTRDMDFTGLSNMMRRVTFNPSRKWRSKSPTLSKSNKTASNVSLQSFKNDENKEPPVIDQNLLRKSRSSAYAKFKYPEKYHKSANFNKHLTLEENIPQCLRKFPHYTNQPKRHSCNYNPQQGAVSFVKKHHLKSGNLPPHVVAKQSTETTQPVYTSTSINVDVDNQETAREIIGLESARDFNDSDDDEAQRNGNFSYVYGEPQTSDVILDMNDIDDNDVNGNDDVIKSIKSEKNVDDDFDDMDKASDVVSVDLPRTDSQEEFEKLLRSIEAKDGNNSDQVSSPIERPTTPLSDIHDDLDEPFKVKQDKVDFSSDEESIPEEI